MANIMIMDTETANTIEQPMPYDFGWAILDDDTGEILVERSYVVAEIFLDKELMSSAYYAEKTPLYWEGIQNGTRILKRFLNIRKILWNDIKKYHITKVGAYNMGFDKRASRNDTRYLTNSFLRFFFPRNIKFFCIWHMACTSFLRSYDYITYAKNNGFVSEKGNILTSAECAYRYIINDPDFMESHTGLEDVRIEISIYMNCKKNPTEDMDDTPNSGCWQKVQKVRKEMEKAGLI